MDHATGYGVYLAYAAECLRQRGEDASSIFRAAGIDDISELGVNQRLPEDVLAGVFRRLYRHPRMAGFFLELGAAVPVTAHGSLGLAFMACDTVYQALEVFVRFAPIALASVRAELEDAGDETVLRIYTSTRYPEFSSALGEALLVNMVVRSTSLAGQVIVPRQASLVQREPSYSDQIRSWIQAPITFNAECHSISYRRKDLDAGVVTADPVNLPLLLAQCEKELAEVQNRTGLRDRVREMLSLNVAENPSISMVARELSLSERTLRRRLQEEGINFRELFKTVRHDLALHYLRDTDAHIQTIAERLGYRDTACFRHAFKEQAGVSPRQWRQQHGSR